MKMSHKLSAVLFSFLTLASNGALADPSILSCRTSSKNIPFEYSSRDSRYSASEVIRICQQNAATDNRECELNLNCNDGNFYPDVVTCDTFSRGRSYTRSVRDLNYARQLTLDDCHHDASTDNRECDVNVRCVTQQSFPQPGPFPPQPSQPALSLQALVGTWQASNCNNCFLQVQLFNGQLYGDMSPWDTNRSYSNGPQPIQFLSENVVLYRTDQYRIQLFQTGPGQRTIVQLVRGTRNASNVESASKEYTSLPPLPPRPPVCPPGSIWDPRSNRCVPIQPPHPVCPPGTVWDQSINRCVSIATPPSRVWVCSIYQFRASSFDQQSAINMVLRQCAGASGGYVCRASDVRCSF